MFIQVVVALIFVSNVHAITTYDLVNGNVDGHFHQNGAPVFLNLGFQNPEHYAPAQYQFKYGVHDALTNDIKQQAETRVGDVVKGHYSFLQPDGRTRIVHYTSDKVNGFQAHVQYSGHAAHSGSLVHKPIFASPVVHRVTVPIYKLLTNSNY